MRPLSCFGAGISPVGNTGFNSLFDNNLMWIILFAIHSTVNSLSTLPNRLWVIQTVFQTVCRAYQCVMKHLTLCLDLFYAVHRKDVVLCNLENIYAYVLGLNPKTPLLKKFAAILANSSSYSSRQFIIQKYRTFDRRHLNNIFFSFLGQIFSSVPSTTQYSKNKSNAKFQMFYR
jgi:hypothetical protein